MLREAAVARHPSPVELETRFLELQAGVLPDRAFRRLACDALAAGYEGVTLRRLAAQIGESDNQLRRLIGEVPHTADVLVLELGLPPRTVFEAALLLVRKMATGVVDGDVGVRDGAFSIVGLAEAVDEPALFEAIVPLEGMVDEWHDFPEAHDAMEAAMAAVIQRLAAPD